MHDGIEQNTSEQIDDAAVDWVAKVDRGPLTAEAASELDQWLAANSRHRGAYVRAQAAFVYLDRKIVPQIQARSEASNSADVANTTANVVPLVSRRRLLWLGGGVAAAAAASAAFFVVGPRIPGVGKGVPPVIYSAKRGEIFRFELQDGTAVTLDTESTVAVRYLEHSREIELIRGRAQFDVAKDKQRPFIVAASGLKVRAVGTSFTVLNMMPRSPEVLVYEGIVDVGSQSGAEPVRVGANMRVVASVTGSPLNVMTIDQKAISHESAWQRGLFEVDEATIGSIAEEYARYSDTRIVIADRSVAALTITGRFFANNPLGFARAAAATFGLKLEVADREIRLQPPKT